MLRHSTGLHQQLNQRDIVSFAPATYDRSQSRHKCLQPLLQTGTSGASRQPARSSACSSLYIESEHSLQLGRSLKGKQPQQTRTTVARVYVATAPYDCDDYEWEEHQAAGDGTLPASTLANPQNQQDCSYNSNQSSSSQHHQGDLPVDEADLAGSGIVGLFVAGWMAIIGLLLKVLQPAAALIRRGTRPLRRLRPALARRKLRRLAADLPEGWWAKLNFLWEQPVVKSIRITLSVANWSVRLPVLLTVLLTQGSLLASQVSLPVLAPLLLGTGMMMNSIKANASFIIPRLGLLVVLLWMLWFMNSVIQTTWLVLRNQGRIDARTMSGARMMTECTSLLLAGIVMLSMLGINVNALLLPTGVVLAIASKDLLQNLIAGFYLVLVQPFRLGDKVAVTCNMPSRSTSDLEGAKQPGSQYSSSGSSGSGHSQGWFEGVCEKVDLRYTVLRDGRRRLMVPNTAFVSREFLVYDDGIPDNHSKGHGSNNSSRADSPSDPWQPDSKQQQQTSAHSSSNAHTSAAEPFIREGHMTTELPPLSAPIFPGVWPAHVGYPPQYAHPQHFAAAAYYTQHVQAHDQMQQQQEKEQDAAAVEARQQRGTDEQQIEQPEQQQQQQQSSRPGSPARGPPGYMPQGFYAPGLRYVGIPVYYGLPGMLGPWEGANQPQQQQHGHGQQQPQQQYYDSPGMHQPIPPYQSDDTVIPQAGTWRHQQHTHRRQQQQQFEGGPQQEQQMDQGSASSQDNSSRSQEQHQQQAHSSSSSKTSGTTVPPASLSQSSQTSFSQPPRQQPADYDVAQQAAHVAAYGGVSGYGYWSYDGLHPGAYHTPPITHIQQQQQQQQDSGTHLGTQQLHAYTSSPQSPPVTSTSISQTSLDPSGAEAAESAVAAGLTGVSALPATGIASAAAAAAAVAAGPAAAAAGHLPCPADAAAVAVTTAQMIAAGGQAAQVVQPLLGMWQDLGLDQLHDSL